MNVETKIRNKDLNLKYVNAARKFNDTKKEHCRSTGYINKRSKKLQTMKNYKRSCLMK